MTFSPGVLLQIVCRGLIFEGSRGARAVLISIAPATMALGLRKERTR
jgi:hypothetical protein